MWLIEIIQQNFEVIHKALGAVLFISVAIIKRTLARMQQKGIVVREGFKRKGKWILIERI